MPMAMIREFLRFGSIGGLLLFAAAALALIVENSPLYVVYDKLLTVPIMIQIGEFIISKPMLLWINDGLMALFFLLIGLEIKREVLEGQLTTREQISLPVIAALGGIIMPAVVFSSINWQDGDAMRGWAIPVATDIAFALGIISLLGKRIPESLKIALTAIAIIDDLVAIVIIAIFYTDNLSLTSLGIAALCIFILALLNWRRIASLTPYMLVGVVLWACVLKSGVHSTLAGVVLAFFIPLRLTTGATSVSPLRKLEHSLHPWVAYAILPVFAFANAGVSFSGLSLEVFLQPLTLGIAAGLFVGNQIGVFALTALGVALKLCKLPHQVSWFQFYGMALLMGVGFTMSLFIGTLAYDDVVNQNAVRLGVLLGSALSGICGVVVLWMASRKN